MDISASKFRRLCVQFGNELRVMYLEGASQYSRITMSVATQRSGVIALCDLQAQRAAQEAAIDFGLQPCTQPCIGRSESRSRTVSAFACSRSSNPFCARSRYGGLAHPPCGRTRARARVQCTAWDKRRCRCKLERLLIRVSMAAHTSATLDASFDSHHMCVASPTRLISPRRRNC